MVDEKITKITKIYEKALGLKGETSQIDIAIEEMCEAIQALIKYKRNEGQYEKIILIDKIAEEIADVEIMLGQMKVTFNIDKECNEWKNKKLLRLQQRLKILEEKNEAKQNGY